MIKGKRVETDGKMNSFSFCHATLDGQLDGSLLRNISGLLETSTWIFFFFSLTKQSSMMVSFQVFIWLKDAKENNYEMHIFLKTDKPILAIDFLVNQNYR